MWKVDCDNQLDICATSCRPYSRYGNLYKATIAINFNHECFRDSYSNVILIGQNTE